MFAGNYLLSRAPCYRGPRTSNGLAGYAERVLINRTLFSDGDLAITEIERQTGNKVTTFRWNDASKGVEHDSVSLSDGRSPSTRTTAADRSASPCGCELPA